MNATVSPRRVWLLATVALLLTFVAGSLAGAAWERWHHAEQRRREGGHGERHAGEMLKRRYGLSDEQARRVEAIVRRRRPRVDSLMATIQPQVRAAFDTTNAEIRLVLTPAQRTKFDRDLERRRRQMGRGHLPPPGAPGAPAPPGP
jgi:Spy/CpxP family protein refolding chaperone